MKITNVEVHGLEDAILASGFAFRSDFDPEKMDDQKYQNISGSRIDEISGSTMPMVSTKRPYISRRKLLFFTTLYP